MGHSPRGPLDPDDLADLYEDQLRRARDDYRPDPMSPSEFAHAIYAREIERAREETEREVRNYFLRVFYAGTDVTQAELGDLVGLTQSAVYYAMQKDSSMTSLSTAKAD